MDNKVSVVIGSWGSYNECNNRALGSKWLDLSKFDSWEDIEQELTKEGFELKGIDEELFVQDYEGFDGGFNGDYMHPKALFETLKTAGVLKHEYLFKRMVAFIEVNGWDEFIERVDNNGEHWGDEVYLYEGYDVYDYGKEKMDGCYQIPEYLERYIDYERFGQDDIDNGYAHQCSLGILEIWD